MNINHLQYFQCLAELQHYSQAANKLHVSQSNLSYAILTLEEELDTKLFEKRGRNVILTKHGAIFLEYVNRALNELAAGKKVVKETLDTERQTVRLSAFRIHSLSWLIQDFLNHEEYQMIHIEVNHNKTVEIIQDLKSQKIDLGFCSYSIDDPTIEFIPILRQKVVVLLPLDHPLSGRKILDLSDVADIPVIIPCGSDGMYKKIVGLFDQIDAFPIQSCKADSSNGAAHFVSMNLGIGITIDNPMLHYFKIKIIPLRNPPHDFYTYLAMVKDQLYSPAVRCFKDYVLSKSNFD